MKFTLFQSVILMIVFGFGFVATDSYSRDALSSNKSPYDFLDQFEPNDVSWTPEVDQAIIKIFEAGDGKPDVKSTEIDLTDYYKEFTADGVVKIYFGMGYEAWRSDRINTVYTMLKALASQSKKKVGDFKVKGNLITFSDLDLGIRYEVTIGNERDEYAAAYGKYEVVMYHGHSRYGRGPAFGSFTNYFRIGYNWDTVEVETNNSYFLNERMLQTNTYPPIDILLSGVTYKFQYRGGKAEGSYLNSNSYTKVIEGNGLDFKNADFLPGRQIFFYYSCSNYFHWHDFIRRQFPDTNQKVVFGTRLPGYWSSQPPAVEIFSIVEQVTSSTEIVSRLNATGDCGADCFVSY